MLKGIQAFEACWTALKQTYPTSNADSQILVQAMGQFVDHYATTEEILQTLPASLKKIFERLIDAYSNGYNPSSLQNWAMATDTQLTPAQMIAAQLRSERARATSHLGPHEMETLIVADLPDR
jgi:hypothetical protein